MNSQSGYRVTLVEQDESEHGHRIGNLNSRKANFGLTPDDGYTLCLLLDGADTRAPLDNGVEWLPVIFRFDAEWGSALVYRLAPGGRITFVHEPWGDRFDPIIDEWWPPSGNLGIAFEPFPERLRDIFGRARWSWYRAQPLLSEAERDYVDDVDADTQRPAPHKVAASGARANVGHAGLFWTGTFLARLKTQTC